MKTEYVVTDDDNTGIAIINNDGKLTSFKVVSEVEYVLNEGDSNIGLDPYYEAEVSIDEIRLISEADDMPTLPIFEDTAYWKLVTQIVNGHFDMIALDMEVDPDDDVEWDESGEADNDELKLES